MRIRSTCITGVSRVARESIPGVTDEGDGRRGTTGGARGVAVRDRWLSNTRHTGVSAEIGTGNVYSPIRREITFNVCYICTVSQVGQMQNKVISNLEYLENAIQFEGFYF